MFDWFRTFMRVSNNRNSNDLKKVNTKGVPSKIDRDAPTLKILDPRDIPAMNLFIMESTKRRGMQKALNGESIGGNADSYRGFPCGAANFIFDRNTGQILEFTNYRSKIPYNCCGMFRLVVYMGGNADLTRKIKTIFFKIIDIDLPKSCPKNARMNIERSVALYNDKYKIKGIDI